MDARDDLRSCSHEACFGDPDRALPGLKRLAARRPDSGVVRLVTAVDAFRGGRRAGLPPIPHLINLELWLRSLPGGGTAVAQAA